jgi:hypothetical protein
MHPAIRIKKLFSGVPIEEIDVTITSAINEATRPYSMALTPDSSTINRRIELIEVPKDGEKESSGLRRKSSAIDIFQNLAVRH